MDRIFGLFFDFFKFFERFMLALFPKLHKYVTGFIFQKVKGPILILSRLSTSTVNLCKFYEQGTLDARSIKSSNTNTLLIFLSYPSQ